MFFGEQSNCQILLRQAQVDDGVFAGADAYAANCGKLVGTDHGYRARHCFQDSDGRRYGLGRGGAPFSGGVPPERLRSRLAYQALRGTGTAADVVVWPKSGFERRANVISSLPATVTREGMLLYGG
jgi:hypothetical protein